MTQTRHVFIRDVLVALGAPGTQENATALVAQCQAEGSPDTSKDGGAKFNPLNCTVKRRGSTNYNDVPVQNYTSWAQGVEATASMLKQANMKPLHDSLMRGTSAADYWSHLPGKWGSRLPKRTPTEYYTIETWLADVRRHWFDRSMIIIAGT